MPVLLYHHLVAERRAVAPTDFEAQMFRLRQLGFTAITLETYVRFMRDERVDLPRRPILITLDDGYISSWENADACSRVTAGVPGHSSPIGAGRVRRGTTRVLAATQ